MYIHIITPPNGVSPTALKIDDRTVTVKDFPAANTRRWTMDKKLCLAAAVLSGLKSPEDLLASYENLSRAELMDWVSALQKDGATGLYQKTSKKIWREGTSETFKSAPNFKTVSARGLTLRSDRVLHDGGTKRLKLTASETRLLGHLMLQPGAVVSKLMILNFMYPGNRQVDPKIIDVFICKIRKKIRQTFGIHMIETSWGRGYLVPR